MEKVVAPWELSFFIKAEISGANCQTFTLGNKGATADFDGIKITMTEAFHSAGAQLTGFEVFSHLSAFNKPVDLVFLRF